MEKTYDRFSYYNPFRKRKGCTTLISETTLAYLAGMLDGEGCFLLQRHYKRSNVSARGYEIEPRVFVTNMNLNNLEKLQQMVGLGKIKVRRQKSVGDGGIRICYDLDFNVGQQRILLPQVMPFLIQKNGRAALVLELLNFRSKGSMQTRQNQKIKPLIEQYYAELEERFNAEKIREKPYLAYCSSRKGHGRKSMFT